MGQSLNNSGPFVFVVSDFEGAVGEHTIENEGVPFAGIQPWCFEPPGRVVATQESEDDIEPPRRRCDQDSEE